LSLAALFWIGSPATAQSTQDNDTTIRDVASFDMFMDAHPTIAEQVRKDPSLVRNQEFVKSHPALQEYIQAHPGVSEEIRENPSAFMHQEQRFEQRQDRRELASLDQFLDSHPEIAEQVRKDPALVNNKEFVEKHPALEQYLQAHAGVAQQWRQNPNMFMQQELRFDQREDARVRGDNNRYELANMDRFLDGHPEIAEQLRKDPSLVNNKEFVAKHPELQSYLQQHPGIREEFSENPNAFMRQEQRFDRQEDGRDHDNRYALANMDRFLDSHPEISEQLRKDPALVNNKEFVAKHPELQTYLQQHPGIREQFSENPNAFMRREQRFDRQEDFGRNNGGFDRDPERREAANFGQFLGGHANIAQQISKDPSLLNNREFMENHPELQEYLKTHPAAQAELKQNPEAFLQSVPQATKPVPKAPTVERPAQKQ
jgi:ABC-type taurine transport system substrate-binding protein